MTSTLPVVRSMHRLVDAAVAVLQLVGAEAERPAEELVAEADPEVAAAPAPARPAAARPGRVVAAGSPGPLEKNTPSGADRQHVVERRGRGQHVHLDAALGHPVRASSP